MKYEVKVKADICINNITRLLIYISYELAHRENQINKIENHFSYIQEEILIRVASHQYSLDKIEEDYLRKLSREEGLSFHQPLEVQSNQDG